MTKLKLKPNETLKPRRSANPSRKTGRKTTIRKSSSYTSKTKRGSSVKPSIEENIIEENIVEDLLEGYGGSTIRRKHRPSKQQTRKTNRIL